MAEIKWVTPIATATAIAESEWKREIETVSTLFDWWRKHYPRDTELDWLLYSGRQGIRARSARHVWNMYRTASLTPPSQHRTIEFSVCEMNSLSIGGGTRIKAVRPKSVV